MTQYMTIVHVHVHTAHDIGEVPDIFYQFLEKKLLHQALPETIPNFWSNPWLLAVNFKRITTSPYSWLDQWSPQSAGKYMYLSIAEDSRQIETTLYFSMPKIQSLCERLWKKLTFYLAQQVKENRTVCVQTHIQNATNMKWTKVTKRVSVWLSGRPFIICQKVDPATSKA